ncbi:MAG: S16 family serine protease [Nanoarchaeota archaeon]
MNRKRIIILLFLSLALSTILLSAASAEHSMRREMKLLAVSQISSTQMRGSIAQLAVEVVPGTGRIFIETFPLTKVDTQISARIAKEIACDFVDVDCRQYDFIYTIKSGAPTIGGPSAGAAIAALTVAALDDLPVDQGVTITGTISSGGLVGPVGGVLAKMQAAADVDELHTVLIPYGERYVVNSSLNGSINVSVNQTVQQNRSQDQIDVVALGADQGVDVVEVYSLRQVVQALTGSSYAVDEADIVVPQFYSDIMGSLAEDLCARASARKTDVDSRQIRNLSAVNVSGVGEEQNLTGIYARGSLLLNSSASALDMEQYYSAASYCFGAGLQFGYLGWLLSDNGTIREALETTRQEIQEYEAPEVGTITDLQTSMLVQERIIESQGYVEEGLESLDEGDVIGARYNLAYAQERFYSARSWASFFDAPGHQYDIDREGLRQACALRIQEAQERQQYVGIYLPFPQETTEAQDLEEAVQKQQQGQYPLCIFYASKSKAYYDLLIGALGTDENQAEKHLDVRLDIARQQIQEQIADEIFPIAAFSYMEYAESLGATDTYSALLYSQYAIELADIDIYLDGAAPESQDRFHVDQIQSRESFLLGMIFGLVAGLVFYAVDKMILGRRNKSRDK